MKILIVGAGPTGLSLATELARQGVVSKLIDKRENISNFSRAVGIVPSTLEKFKLIGIHDEVIKEGVHINHAKIFHDDKLLLDISLEKAKTNTEYNFIISLPQDRTEALIEKRFEEFGGKVEYGVELLSVKQNSNNTATAIYASGEEETFDYIVGADGSRSKVMQSMDVKKVGYDLPETWHIADFYTKESDEINTATISRSKNLFFMIRMAEKRYRAVSNAEIDLSRLPYGLTVDRVYREGSFKISIRQAEIYYKGNIILCGDAAHTHSPVGGRGMNLGIEDAFELAEALIGNNLDGYNKKQHARGKQIIKATEEARKMFTAKDFFRKNLLNMILHVVAKIPKLQSKIAKGLLTF
ncbi:FAD-dependent oxidoreductase [Pseudofrancisella aestuarii]|uniref:FAD-dependent oxidoreductase n=1 Tax=Pseudofrancisella aestuarii TaxID=2670347 RepID=A0ABV9TCE3_9GAMM|nr:NAD(P)/FAD-dependent oxidoreductase [Pseudofrancisella aestuarii]